MLPRRAPPMVSLRDVLHREVGRVEPGTVTIWGNRERVDTRSAQLGDRPNACCPLRCDYCLPGVGRGGYRRINVRRSSVLVDTEHSRQGLGKGFVMACFDRQDV